MTDTRAPGAEALDVYRWIIDSPADVLSQAEQATLLAVARGLSAATGWEGAVSDDDLAHWSKQAAGPARKVLHALAERGLVDGFVVLGVEVWRLNTDRLSALGHAQLPARESDLGVLFPADFNPARHHDLVAIAVRWLRSHHKCGIAFAEMYIGRPIIPDAIGFRFGCWSVLVECKVSRSDFRSDVTKRIHTDPDACPGQERWYLTPPNLVRPDEVPPGWGLAECDARRVRVVLPSPRTIHDLVIHGRSYADLPFLAAAVRRHEVGVVWQAELGRFESMAAADARENASLSTEPLVVRQ